MTNLPDYYSILDIPETATQEDIRQAYKKQALLHHPDRLPDTATAAERAEQTRQFQLIADAYYILSDSTRREAFDRNRAQHRTFASSSTAEPTTSTNYAHHMFGNVFEELLRPEVEHPSHLWRILGAGAGAILGFIIGNVGGLAVGAFAGKTLGQIRDHKGVSVYTAFQRLAIEERRDILTALLTRFFTHGAAGMMK